ncbi:hypothetical protein [Caballeronia sp. Lep1P3]|uniref:hypothetical protein n=1 Tax=Caballeronia sp. Lep1P3 TaxID=2878150 RepID=UPI001FD47B80|nr:hypothetical protein [Caballeronia sp. Lep1P3]
MHLAQGECATRYRLGPSHVIREAQGHRTIDTLRQLAPAGADAEADAQLVMRREHEDAEGIVEAPDAARLLRDLPGDRWAVVTSEPRRATC